MSSTEEMLTALEIDVKPRPRLPKYSHRSVVRRKKRLAQKLGPNPTYGEKVRWAVRMKWPEAEMKEWWYALQSAARKRKTILLHEKQGGKCIFCNQDTWVFESARNGLGNRKRATLDHVKPQSRGGSDNLRNLVMACAACNNIRQNMKFEKFMALRTDPDRWSAHCKMLSRIKSEKAKKVPEKRLDARNKFIVNLALFGYYFPEHAAYLRFTVSEQVQKQAERLKELRTNPMVDPDDILTNST